MKTSKKIGIACGCRKLNYGSILQSFALAEFVKHLGYECEFVWLKGSLFKHFNIRPGKILGVIGNALRHPSIAPKALRSINRVLSRNSSYSVSNATKAMYDAFVAANINVHLFSWRELQSRESEYAKFVCGSDQIWNSYEYYLDPMYFLRFAPPGKRIAYAPSFGTDSVSFYNRKTLEKYLKEMSFVSVREESGQAICKELTGRDVPVVADPTFLFRESEWAERLSIVRHDGDYCLAYFLNCPDMPAQALLEEIRRRKIPVKSLPLAFDCYGAGESVDAGPREFLQLLMNAKYIVTDSFHGTILSMNFRKNFLCFERQYGSAIKQSSRITDILGKMGLGERYNTKGNSGRLMDALANSIDYGEVNERIECLRTSSMEYLKRALEA